MTRLILVLVASLLAGTAAAEESDRAKELTRRTYAIHTVSKDLLATGTSYGLVLYRLNDRGFPTRAGALKLGDAVTALASKDSLIYAGNGPRGLVVIDVADPDAPVEIARVATPGAVLRLLSLGNRLYAAMGTMGVGVIDLEDPRAPTFALRHDLPGNTRDLEEGSKGIVAAAETLTWLMAPDSEFPMQRGSGFYAPTALVRQGRLLAAAARKLFRVDASGFISGQVLTTDDEIRDLERIPGGVAVAASSDGLVLLENDTLAIRVAARLDPGGACTRVHARGDLLFATADAYGFAVYNVKDPAKPVKIHPADIPE